MIDELYLPKEQAVCFASHSIHASCLFVFLETAHSRPFSSHDLQGGSESSNTVLPLASAAFDDLRF